MNPLPITLIAAMDRNRAIGYKNELLWTLPEDMKFFKATTLNKPVIMGRKTHESIGRALPKRYNIVISRQPVNTEGMVWASSIDEAITHAQAYAENHGSTEMMVIGGAEVYAQCLPYATRVYLTTVDTCVRNADAFFPVLPRTWTLKQRVRHPILGLQERFPHSQDNLPTQFWISTYEREQTPQSSQAQMSVDL